MQYFILTWQIRSCRLADVATVVKVSEGSVQAFARVQWVKEMGSGCHVAGQNVKGHKKAVRV